MSQRTFGRKFKKWDFHLDNDTFFIENYKEMVLLDACPKYDPFSESALQKKLKGKMPTSEVSIYVLHTIHQYVKKLLPNERKIS